MLIKWLEKIQLTIGVLFLAIFFTAVVIQVTAREILGISVIWTVEVSKYSFIWAVFMGASVMLNRREHFNFDFLLKKLQGKARTLLTIVNDIILLLFNLAIFYYGIKAVESFWNYNWVSIPELKMGYVWISIPIMGLTMSIYTIAHLIRSFKSLSGKEVTQ